MMHTIVIGEEDRTTAGPTAGIGFEYNLNEITIKGINAKLPINVNKALTTMYLKCGTVLFNSAVKRCTVYVSKFIPVNGSKICSKSPFLPCCSTAQDSKRYRNTPRCPAKKRNFGTKQHQVFRDKKSPDHILGRLL